MKNQLTTILKATRETNSNKILLYNSLNAPTFTKKPSTQLIFCSWFFFHYWGRALNPALFILSHEKKTNYL